MEGPQSGLAPQAPVDAPLRSGTTFPAVSGKADAAASASPAPISAPGVPVAPPVVAPAELAAAEAEQPLAGASEPSNDAPLHAPATREPGPRAYEGDPAGTTAPQLRRFIKSRAYVPMHELRRRFGINGNDDDVTMVELDGCRVYVGLPNREGHLLGELLRGGEVGYEVSYDPFTPIVVGVYPMRPVPRH